MPHPLDNPVLSSLTGPHSRFAERRGNVLRYQADVCPFVAMPDQPVQDDWSDAGGLAGPGAWLPLAAIEISPPAGWEVSAVCTDEAWRGRGLGARLIRAVGAGIQARGDTPFLHALTTNPAIGLYEELGFRHRMTVLFAVVRVPRTQPADRGRDGGNGHEDGTADYTQVAPRRQHAATCVDKQRPPPAWRRGRRTDQA